MCTATLTGIIPAVKNLQEQSLLLRRRRRRAGVHVNRSSPVRDVVRGPGAGVRPPRLPARDLVLFRIPRGLLTLRGPSAVVGPLILRGIPQRDLALDRNCRGPLPRRSPKAKVGPPLLRKANLARQIAVPARRIKAKVGPPLPRIHHPIHPPAPPRGAGNAVQGAWLLRGDALRVQSVPIAWESGFSII